MSSVTLGKDSFLDRFIRSYAAEIREENTDVKIFSENYSQKRDFYPRNVTARELSPEEKKQNHIETILLMSIPIILILECLAAAIYAICTYSSML